MDPRIARRGVPRSSLSLSSAAVSYSLCILNLLSVTLAEMMPNEIFCFCLFRVKLEMLTLITVVSDH